MLDSTGEALDLDDVNILLGANEAEYMAQVERRMLLHHPAGFPRLVAAGGLDPAGRALGLITSEYPEPVRFRRMKAIAEEQHLDRFVTDHRRATGADPFDSFHRGDDPPDFVVRRDGREVGLDVTQLVSRRRVEAHEGLQGLRSAALMRGRRAFRRLQGHIVHVALVGRDARWSPMIEKTLEALEQLDPRGQRIWTPDGTTRSKFIEIGDSEGFATAGPLRASLAGSFYGQMGFEVLDCHATAIYADEAWQTLQDLVTDHHDKPGIDELLVAATAPVGGGFAFPSDVMTATLAFARADAGSALRAVNIKKVYLHVWLVRSIDALEPGVPGAVEIARDDVAVAELYPQGFYTPDSEALYDWDATEIVALGLADVFVRHSSTGERQVFVRTGEVRGGLGVWRRDDTRISDPSATA